ncbi:MAG: STAS/SEC14 domain-containing protein [Leptospiraceae bacterium]|nr:hypothetical protein [Leptospiraceae bacterium]MCP5496286.1 STAS/SEC14 domain-containing protein [Leptospiraceae bacterium]
MQQIIHLRKKKLSTVLSKNETMLFRKINKGAPKFIQKRYESLIKKKNEETLSQAEYEELLELTSYMESLQVERLENLIELAKFQNISLDELIDQLELKPKINVL